MRVLTHLHIYYEEQTDYFLSKLLNINSCEWDLFVTYISLNETTIEKIKKFKPDTVFVQVKNIGYDVYPFIQIIQRVNLDDYDFVLKLHTKNTNPEKYTKNSCWKGSVWRDVLTDSLLSDKKRFRKNLEILSRSEYGMLYSKRCISHVKYSKGISEILYKEGLSYGFDLMDYCFCAGTMFMIKAELLKFVQTRKFIDDDFYNGDLKTGSNNTLAHIYERLLCIETSLRGLKTYLVDTNTFSKRIKLKIEHFLNFFFSCKNSYEFGYKLKFIKLFGLKFYLYPKTKKLVFDKNLKEFEKVINIEKSGKHRRTAIFAAFNKDGKIPDYVVYLLKNLKSVVDNIVMVMDNPVDEKELDKISDYVSVFMAKRHEEYDFGSYKRGCCIAAKYGLFGGGGRKYCLSE